MNSIVALPFNLQSASGRLLCIFILQQFFLLSACTSQPQSQAYTVARTKDLSDSALLDTVEKQTFGYFWKGAEPNSGMAPERISIDNDYPDNDQHIVTTGGSGFG